MKIERLLLGLFASFLMVGCSQNDDSPNAGEEQVNGKNKDSYMAVNIVSSNTASRAATEGDFEYGKGIENKVNNAHFFFFNSDGSPYELQAETADYTVDGSTATVSGEAAHNWLYFSSFVEGTQESGTPAGSVEKVLNAVLIFKGKSSTVPAKVVAVLNLDHTLLSNSISLKEVPTMLEVAEEKAFSTENNGNFVMSNSVYAKGTNNETIVNATDISDKAKNSVEAALNDAVNIYVERLAVKVTVNNSISGTTTSTNVEAGGKTVYAKILGWDLNTTINKSHLLKDITNAANTWGSSTATWNASQYYRSYWASSVPSSGSYKTSFSWHGLKNTLGSSDYCLENVSTSDQTKIVVSAQLVDDQGNALTLAQWMGTYYVVETETNSGITTKKWEEGLLTAVANSLNLYKEVSSSYVKIAPSDIQIVPKYTTASGTTSTNSHDFYKVDFAFKSSGTWYKGTGTGNNITVDDQNPITATEGGLITGVVPAKVWQDGATYYFTNIEHFNGKDAVIRNHHYVVNITGAVGLGTPVYYPDGYKPEDSTPDIPEIPDPVVPSDDETYLSAKINVLSWKIVNNDVTLGQ